MPNTSAIAELVEQAVAAVQALGLSGVLDANVVGLTVLTDADKHVAAFPAVVVGPFGTERIAPATNLADDIGYPLAVVLIDGADNDQSTADLDTRMRWREQITDHFLRNRMTATLPAGCGLVDQQVEPLPMVDLPAWFQKQAFVSSQIVRFVVRRRRRAV